MRDEERKRSKRRGKNDAGKFTSVMNSWRVAFGENSLTLWAILCIFPVNKSIVSSSISSECTLFQTLDNHVTQPVLFIPETHISSLQRMVGPNLHNFSLLSQPWFRLLHPHRHETGMGENRWESGLGRGGYGVSRFKQQRSDELIGVETSRMCMPLQLLTPSFGYGGLCECRHTPGEHRYLTHTNMRHPPPTPPHYSNMHVRAKTARWECCSDRPVFPQSEVGHLWESVE